MEITPQELQAIINDAVDRAIAKYTATMHVCRLPISDEMAEKIPLVISAIEDLGEEPGLDPDTNFERGVKQMAKNHKWTSERQDEWEPEFSDNHKFTSALRAGVEKFKEKAGNAIVNLLIWGLLAAMGLGAYAKITTK